MGNHEFCTGCGESDFHLGRPCDPEKARAYAARLCPPAKPKPFEEVIAELKRDHGDAWHVLLMNYAHTLYEHNAQLLARFQDRPGTKRPFSDALANSVIAGQVRRIIELETKLGEANTRNTKLEERQEKQWREHKQDVDVINAAHAALGGLSEENWHDLAGPIMLLRAELATAKAELAEARRLSNSTTPNTPL